MKNGDQTWTEKKAVVLKKKVNFGNGRIWDWKKVNKQTNKKKWRYMEGTIKTLVDKRNKEGSQQS